MRHINILLSTSRHIFPLGRYGLRWFGQYIKNFGIPLHPPLSFLHIFNNWPTLLIHLTHTHPRHSHQQPLPTILSLLTPFPTKAKTSVTSSARSCSIYITNSEQHHWRSISRKSLHIYCQVINMFVTTPPGKISPSIIFFFSCIWFGIYTRWDLVSD